MSQKAAKGKAFEKREMKTYKQASLKPKVGDFDYKYSLFRYALVWYRFVWYGMVQFDLYALAWFGLVQCIWFLFIWFGPG